MNLIRQYNYVTKKDYTGSNQALLLTAKIKNNFISDAWLTRKQAKTQELTVIRNSQATTIFKGIKKIENVNGKKQLIKKSLGSIQLFNIDQIKTST
jgi:antirestriction protein ArdC